MTVALLAVIGGIWRRWLGGAAPKAPRWLKLAVWALITFFALSVYQNPWNVIPWAILCVLWVPGHRWDYRGKMYVRYALPLLAVAPFVGWEYALTGPLLVEGYMLAGWYGREWPNPFMWSRLAGQTRGWIDGPFALAELWAGAVVLGMLAVG